MKTTISLLFILILSLAAFSQENKSVPEDKAAREEIYSSVFDIKDFKRFHILTQSKDSKASILEVLKKENSLELSDEPSARTNACSIQKRRSNGTKGDYQTNRFISAYHPVKG